MLLGMITVTFRNLEGIIKTHTSLVHLTQMGGISFEWIVVDGDSDDGAHKYLKNLSSIFSLRFISEPGNGIYDVMNKGIAMAQGKFALFLNSGDISHQNAADFIRKLKIQKDNVMIIGNALLDFGNGHKIKCNAKPGWYIYHSLPASHRTIFFPASGLKKWRCDLEYKVFSDYALTARIYRAGYAFKKLNGLVSEFSMDGISTTNNMELYADAKKVQRRILHVPGFWTKLSWHLRQHTTSKTKALYNKVWIQGEPIQDLSGFLVPKGFQGGSAIKMQLWWTVQVTIFAWSPQVLYRWRVFLLRLFGAKIEKNMVIRPSVEITYSQKLTLGDYAWVGSDVNLYTLGEAAIGVHSVIS